jgi:tol-pal system protein YbgF
MASAKLLISVTAVAVLVMLAQAHAQSGPPGQAALETEMRMNALEDQMRQLTGRIEELTNTVNQLKTQLDRQQSDTDLRFNQLQGGAPPPAAASDGAANAAVADLPPQLKPPQGAGADLSQPASRSGDLGALASPGGAPAPTQTAAAGAGALPAGGPQEQYNYAMGLLTQANYPAAEQAMKAFVERFPKDALAGNAQYWLGETYYVRKDYGDAATAFAQGYEKYPKSPKAADDLLKLGMSLTALNQKPDACKAYARLQRDFPAPPQSIKDRLGSEKQRAGC